MQHLVPGTIVALTVTLSTSLSAGTSFEATRLGNFGGTDSRATDINDNGTVVGYSFLPGDTVSKAFSWNGGPLQQLPGLSAGSSTKAWGINNNGDIVGEDVFQGGTFPQHATHWTGGGVTDLNTTHIGSDHGVAWDINENGQIVGQAHTDDLQTFSDGFIITPGTGNEFAGTLDGRTGGANFAIDNSGWAVGHSFNFLQPSVAHLAVPGDRGYDSFAISPTFPGGGLAHDISETGIIVGEAAPTFGPTHAAIFVPTPELYIDLGVLPGADSSRAFGVNDAGLVVGTSGDNPAWATGHAFVWMDDTMLDLNDLLNDPGSEWDTLVEATAINNNNTIVGWGLTTSGEIAAFTMTVPGPVTAALLPIGALPFLTRRR